MKVLVVDAAVAVRSRLVALLGESGVTVVAEAASSLIARAYVAEHAPDAIVLDVELPDRGGLSLIEELSPTITVIVLTNALSYRRRCLMLGAHAFLDKSADFAAVAQTLTSIGNLLRARA